MLRCAHAPRPFLGLMGRLRKSQAPALSTCHPDALSLYNLVCICRGQVCKCGTFGIGKGNILPRLSGVVAMH